MGHAVRLLAGPRAALRPFLDRAPGARLFALTPAAPILVLPLTEAVHDALHAANGTGEWFDFSHGGPAAMLSTTDMAYAASASLGTILAWIEITHAGPHGGMQAAAVWIDGALQMRPMALGDPDRRPASLRPVNAALRLLGVAVSAPTGGDAAAAFGLSAYRSNDDIVARALPVRP